MCGKTNCAMFHDHYTCKALVDTNFGERECPFFKTSSQAYYDQIKAEAHNDQAGIPHDYKGPRFATMEDWLNNLRERGIIPA